MVPYESSVPSRGVVSRLSHISEDLHFRGRPGPTLAGAPVAPPTIHNPTACWPGGRQDARPAATGHGGARTPVLYGVNFDVCPRQPGAHHS